MDNHACTREPRIAREPDREDDAISLVVQHTSVPGKHARQATVMSTSHLPAVRLLSLAATDVIVPLP